MLLLNIWCLKTHFHSSCFYLGVLSDVSPLANCVTEGCVISLDAFVWPFSTVLFQMALQIACHRRCIVTLVAFVWLFSTVRCYRTQVSLVRSLCPDVRRSIRVRKSYTVRNSYIVRRGYIVRKSYLVTHKLWEKVI